VGILKCAFYKGQGTKNEKTERLPAPFEIRKIEKVVLATIATITAFTAETATTLATTTAATEATTFTAAAAEAATTLATTEAAASRTVFLRTGFIDGELTATEFGTVHLFSGILGFFSRAHGHESETARAARHTIEGDVNVSNGAKLFENGAQLVSGGLERQVTDVEFGTLHVMIS
jgi:hypothetical protein